MENAFERGDLVEVDNRLAALSDVELREILPNHTIKGLPTLHQLARVRFQSEDKVLLDKIIRLFIDSGYDVNKQSDSYSAQKRASLGFTALMAAIEQSNILLIESLIRNGARMDIRDENGYTPCHWAIIVGDIKCLKTVIEHGAPVASTEKELSGLVHPIIHTAVDEGRTEMVFFLLQKDLVDVNETAIYKGVLSEQAFTQFPSRYSNEPATLETIDARFTPLARAVRMRKISIIELLLKYNAKLSEFDELHFCIVEGDTELACLLLNYFSDDQLCSDKIMDKWALHCLHSLAFQDELRLEKTIELILNYVDAGWDINSVTTCSITRKTSLPFFLAGHEVSFSFSEFTLLHIACLSKGHDVIKCIVQEGANINCKTNGDFQLLPLQILLILKQWASAIYLIEKGANLCTTGGFMNIVFTRFLREDYLSASKGESDSSQDSIPKMLSHFNSVELLLQLGCEDGLPVLNHMLELKDADELLWKGSNLFHIAIEGGNPDYASLVLQHFAKSITKEDLTWVKHYNNNYPQKAEKIPSFLWLLHTVSMQTKTNVTAIAELMKLLASHGYDYNLICDSDVKNAKFTEAVIFFVLTIDFKHETSLLLQTLLGFNHVCLNVRNSKGRNPVEHVIDMWHERCIGDFSNCWKSEVNKKLCYETVKLLVNHGVGVAEMIIGDNFKYHFGYKNMLKMLYCAGAKLNENFFLSPVCHAGYLGTRPFSKEIKEFTEWKETYDSTVGISLKRLTIIRVRDMLKSVGDLRILDALPKVIKEEVLIM